MMDISEELKAVRAEIDAEVQNFLTLLKENINTEVTNAGQYLAAVRERQGTLAMEHAKGQGKILHESLTNATREKLDLIDKAFNRTVKVIHGAEERVEKTIKSGLAAIEDAKQEAIAAIRAERDRDIAAVRESADSEMANLEVAAQRSLAIIEG